MSTSTTNDYFGKANALAFIIVSLLFCTSGSELDVRNKEIFDEAKQNLFQNFTTTAYTFNGNIDVAIDLIDNLAPAATDSVIADTIIEGIVTIPSDYGFGAGTSGCGSINAVFQRSFVLQDQNTGILVAYGLEPPLFDTSQSTSMKYVNNARMTNRAVFGDRIRLTATRAMYYGSGSNVIPVITDFKDVQIISWRNAVATVQQTTAFVRNTDLFRVRILEGFVKTSPSYKECTNGTTRQFQYNYQDGYVGELCVNATSATDATACTGGSKFLIKFQLSRNMGSGTLSGFDTGNSFSYNLAKGAKVRMRGPVGVPVYNGGVSELMLMIGQKFQVETLQ